MAGDTSLTPGGNAALPGPGARAEITATGTAIDVSAVLLTAARKVRGDSDLVFYNHPAQDGVTVNGPYVSADFGRLPADVHTVAVVASVDADRPDAVFDGGSGLRVDVTSGDARIGYAPPPLRQGETVVILAEFYRRGDTWKVRAVGQGYANGLAGLAQDFGVDVDEPDPVGRTGPAADTAPTAARDTGHSAGAAPTADRGPTAAPATDQSAPPAPAPPPPSPPSPPGQGAAPAPAQGLGPPQGFGPPPQMGRTWGRAPAPAPLPAPGGQAAPPAWAPPPPGTPAAPLPPPPPTSWPQPQGPPAPSPAPPMPPAPPAPPAPAPSSGRNVAPAISLEKVERAAPALVSLYKQAGISLHKRGITGQRAAVYLVLDHSASMKSYYRSGTMQHLAEQVLGLSANLDDDGIVPVVVFSSRVDLISDISLDNHAGRVEELHRKLPWGGTCYAPAMRAVIDHYLGCGATDPAYVVFQSDGEPFDRGETKRLLQQSSTLPIFWQFVGFGGTRLKFLRGLDTLKGRAVDNAGFFAAGRDPRERSDAELYDCLMAEFPRWLAAARQAGFVR
jgi:stress response protein SCP2